MYYLPIEKYGYTTSNDPNLMEKEEINEHLKGDFRTDEGLPVYLCDNCPVRISFEDRHSIRFGEHLNGMSHRTYFGTFCDFCRRRKDAKLADATNDQQKNKWTTWEELSNLYRLKSVKRQLKPAHKE